MANTDKNIVITPNIGNANDDPKIVFTAANTTNAYTLTVKAYPVSNGTLSVEGGAGQLFSITNTMSGIIHSVNDISGMPSLEVYDTGDIRIAQYSGNVLIGTGTSDNVSKLQVAGTANLANVIVTGTVNLLSTMVLANGAVGAPSLTHQNDLTTGLWFPAANTVALSTAGTERLRVDSAGNVGVKIAPISGADLHVNGLGYFAGGDAEPTSDPSGGGGISLSYNKSANSGIIRCTRPGIETRPLAMRATKINFESTDEITFTKWTIGAERMRITSAGLVGIGTTAPDALLTVNGIASFGDGAVGTPSIAHQGDLNTGLWFPAADTVAVSTNGAERIRIASDGKVGIGTSTPNAVFQVAGKVNIGPGTFNNSGAGYASGLNLSGDIDLQNYRLYMNLAGSGNYYLSSSTLSIGSVLYNDGLIRTAGGFLTINPASNAAVVFAGGSVGVSTSTPDANLTVNGIASFGDGAVGTPSIAHQGDLNTGLWFPAADTVAVSTNGSERLRIDANGNVSVGTTSTTSKLQVVGTTTLTGNVVITGGISANNSYGTSQQVLTANGAAGISWTTLPDVLNEFLLMGA